MGSNGFGENHEYQTTVYGHPQLSAPTRPRTLALSPTNNSHVQVEKLPIYKFLKPEASSRRQNWQGHHYWERERWRAFANNAFTQPRPPLMATTSGDGPRLPFELYRPIIRYAAPYVPDRYIRFWMYVSRWWRYEIESLFYESVDVPEMGLLYFCRTIIDRPDLARRVLKLEFTSAADHPRRDGDDEMVARALKLLVNLKDLSIKESQHWRVQEWVLTHQHYWVLHDVPFQLTYYESHFTWGQEFLDFLATQPGLREFVHAGSTLDDQQPRIQENTLVRANALSISPHIISGFKRPRRVTNLQLNFWQHSAEEEEDAVKALRAFSRHLSVLMICRKVGLDEYVSAAQMIRTFSKHTPNLTVFGFFDSIDYSNGDNKRILQALSEKDRFQKLQVFIWAPWYLGSGIDEDVSSEEDGFSVDSDDEEKSPLKIQRYALALMKAVPSLQCFVSFRGSHMHCWLRGQQEDTVVPWNPPNPITPSSHREINPDAPLEFFIHYRDKRFWEEVYYLPENTYLADGRNAAESARLTGRPREDRNHN
ncbi:hypothetical protein BV25DRAFT_1922272 [Artomyces pyxidatus]|uniref:Uncharacterized protein n=1 Tax=Artomyces pyxidatus TaxID=48021 RepID=A0ACB8SGJ3_9AGAM|nr:hypothetical protein BV25DRAFT_1922272 [Artomyces pyxidatus]